MVLKYILKIVKVILLVSFILFVAYQFVFWLDRRIEKSEIQNHSSMVRIPENNVTKLQTGDIILRRGFGLISDMVSDTQKLKYDVTHCGFILKIKEKYYVIHALSSDVAKEDGIQLQTLHDFLQASDPKKILITRYKKPIHQFEHKMLTTLSNYHKQKAPFDRDGNFDDQSKLFCSELIINVLSKDMKLFDLPKNKQQRKQFYYSLSTLYKRELFNMIYSTF